MLLACENSKNNKKRIRCEIEQINEKPHELPLKKYNYKN